MHPGLGAGVMEHSAFFTEPWDRIIRSIPEILGVVYDGPDAEATGHRVRDYHRRIKGVDSQGRRYSALKPETFWWAHATFQFSVEQVADRFDTHRCPTRDREQLYREGVEWYRRYGVSMRPVPADHDAFVVRWNHYCMEILELTEAAERTIDIALNSKVDDLPGPTGLDEAAPASRRHAGAPPHRDRRTTGDRPRTVLHSVEPDRGRRTQSPRIVGSGDLAIHSTSHSMGASGPRRVASGIVCPPGTRRVRHPRDGRQRRLSARSPSSRCPGNR